MTPSTGGSAGKANPAVDDALDEARRDLHQGLFGPGSVTWRLHADPLYPLAMLRGLLMDVLHVPSMAVVFAPARRLDDPWERLHHALQLSGTVTFGDASEAAIMGARDRSVRMQVRGVTDEGREFCGDDESVLVWQHACRVSSAVEIAQRSGLALDGADASRYLREQVRTAAVLGLEPDQVPVSRNELTRRLRSTRSQLRVTHESRAFLNSVISPTLPTAMQSTQRHRPRWSPVAGLAYATLPAWARNCYGPPPPGSPAALSQAATTVALHALRESLAVGALPHSEPTPSCWS